MEDLNRTAAGLEEVAEGFRHLAKIYRGEEQDLTGRGFWQILCDHLGETMGVKVISLEQYAAFRELSDKEVQRQVAERDQT